MLNIADKQWRLDFRGSPQIDTGEWALAYAEEHSLTLVTGRIEVNLRYLL